MSKTLEGKPVAAAIGEKTMQAVQALKGRGIYPGLAVVRVGENDGDIAYERSAAKRCESLGIDVRKVTLPKTVTQADLIKTIQEINEDDQIHGCLILRPLPNHMDDALIRRVLCVEKDVDGITDGSLAGIFAGSDAGFAPCTAVACLEVLKYYDIDIQGKNVVVLGRSLVIGKPVAMLVLHENATVTICHTKTKNLAAVCEKADILIAAAGKQGLVTQEFFNDEQVVLDVGIHVSADGKIAGDVDFPAAKAAVFAASPVPGGIGAVTTAVLAAHVVKAASRIDSPFGR